MKKRIGKALKKNYELYLFLLPVIIYYILFHYLPIYGVQIAFKDFIAVEGIQGSPWVGFKHFIRFFKSYQFDIVIRNTLGLSVYQLALSFPMPIIFALLLNQIKHTKIKKSIQSIVYLPHFISTVVLTGMILIFLSPTSGFVNKIIEIFGGKSINFMAEARMFKTIYVVSGVWQNMGYSSIIYIAALTCIDMSLYEAADVEGATIFQKIVHIEIPSILPTAITILILSVGNIMSIGFEKVYLMQNSLNIDASEIISTYVYKVGLINAQYSFSSAVGLFNSIINCILLVSVNYLARIFGETSLW